MIILYKHLMYSLVYYVTHLMTAEHKLHELKFV